MARYPGSRPCADEAMAASCPKPSLIASASPCWPRPSPGHHHHAALVEAGVTQGRYRQPPGAGAQPLRLSFSRTSWSIRHQSAQHRGPYGIQGKDAIRFIERALELVRPHRGTVAMLLKADFDSGITRRRLFADCSAWGTWIVHDQESHKGPRPQLPAEPE
jgi:hypothetical protein